MKPSRCEFLTLLGVTAITGNPPWQPRFVGAKAWSLDLTRNISSGDLLKDGVPPIDWPTYVSVEESEKLLHAYDIGFGLERRDNHALRYS